MREVRGWLYHPTFPEHWVRMPLYSLASWVNGLAFRDIHFSSTGRPVIKIAEVKSGISDQTKFTEQEFDPSVHVARGDLLFSWSGQPETSIDAYWWRGSEGWLNQHLFRVTPSSKVDRTFFFYLLRYLRPQFVGIARNKQTTGLGHVTRRDLEAIQVGTPPLPEQRAIAEVLGALDDKIEANRQICQTLDESARALVGLAQEDAHDRVPLGEVVDRVADIVQPSDLDGATMYVGLEHIPRGNLFLSAWGTAHSVVSAKARFRVEDVLFGKLRPYFKKVVVAPGSGVCSTDVLVLRPRHPEQSAFAAVVCAGDDVIAHASAGSQGTRMPRASWEHLAGWPVALPASDVLSSLQATVAPVLRLGVQLTHESIRLTQLRDALLPKLLSGALHLRDVDRVVEAPL